MHFWSIPCSIYNSSTEPRGCLVQISHLLVSAQQTQMVSKTSVFPGANSMTQLVDRVKYGLGQGATLGEGKCRSQAVKLIGLDACKNWHVFRWSDG